jgi:hypothetical protein
MDITGKDHKSKQVSIQRCYGSYADFWPYRVYNGDGRIAILSLKEYENGKKVKFMLANMFTEHWILILVIIVAVLAVVVYKKM